VEILSDWMGPNGAGQMLARWGHYVAGAAWVGLLYYFNFVQAPAFAHFSDATRADALREIAARGMWWRRWSAVATVATGVLILFFQDPLDGDYLRYFATPQGTAIAFGSVLALVMFGNVWLVIAPNQEIVIASAQDAVSGRGPRADAPLAAKRLARAERCNTLLSVPMLWFMAVAPHFAGGVLRFATLPGRDYVGSAWVVFIILVGVIELSALGQIGGYDSTANRLLFDSTRWVLLWGVVLWALLWFGAFEAILGDA
jgi:uncharacterized membrane protein